MLTKIEILTILAAVCVPSLIVDFIRYRWRSQAESGERKQISALYGQLIQQELMHNETIKEYQKQIKNLQDEFISLKVQLNKKDPKSE